MCAHREPSRPAHLSLSHSSPFSAPKWQWRRMLSSAIPCVEQRGRRREERRGGEKKGMEDRGKGEGG